MEHNSQPTVVLNWRALLDDRQLSEIRLACYYAANFPHGTDGHSRLMLIARMSALLDMYEAGITTLQNERRERSSNSG